MDAQAETETMSGQLITPEGEHKAKAAQQESCNSEIGRRERGKCECAATVLSGFFTGDRASVAV